LNNLTSAPNKERWKVKDIIISICKSTYENGACKEFKIWEEISTESYWK
jgi:hypothetical protein